MKLYREWEDAIKKYGVHSTKAFAKRDAYLELMDKMFGRRKRCQIS
jgi:hypothetical protein